MRARSRFRTVSATLFHAQERPASPLCPWKIEKNSATSAAHFPCLPSSTAAIAASPDGLRLVLEQGGAPIADVLDDAATLWRAARAAGGLPAAVSLAVGPEGGFEPAELEELRAAGFVPVGLGRSILRFETAALAGLAAVRAVLERVAVTN